MIHRLLISLPFIVIIGLISVFYLGLNKGNSAPPSPMVGKRVPEFFLADPPPQTKVGFQSYDLQGQVSVLNVFATWCIPCLAEMPLLEDLRYKYNVRIYGLLYKDDPIHLENWFKEKGHPFIKIGLDKEGKTALSLGIRGVPETFVIDPEGVIRYHLQGPLTQEIINETILPLIQKLQL